MTNRPYNERDISSIFNYSKQLVNKCLRDFAPDAEEHNGKGSLGQLVEELFFKYDLNSRQEADFAFLTTILLAHPTYVVHFLWEMRWLQGLLRI